MERRSFSKMQCPIARSLERVGEWWSILIIRDALHGLTRFDQFQESLGIAPNMLTRRLGALVKAGLMERRRYSERPPRYEYVLMERGREFRSVIVAMYAWGNKHFAPEGASVLLAVALLYGFVLAGGTPEPQARAMAFAAVVFGNLGLILTNRSRHEPLLTTLRRPNPALAWIIAAALLGLAAALYMPPLREIFRFGALTGYELLGSLGAAVAGLAWLEVYKFLRYRASRNPPRRS